MQCWRLLLPVELSEHLGVIVGIRESLTHAILDPVCSRGHLLDRVLQDSFLDHVAVRVFNPSLVADRSQILDKRQCMLRIVRMYLRGSARTLRFHNHTHVVLYHAQY